MNLKIATKENEQPERWKVFVRNIPFIFVPIWQLGILILPIQWLFIRWTRFSQRPLDRLLGIYVIDVPPQEQMRRTTWLQKAISGFRS
jgi:hypothetical protein